MKVIILCGGRGIRVGNEPDYLPKAMIKLGHRPMIWHIVKRYSLAGYNNFILALGLKGELIRDYFTRYQNYINDIEVDLSTGHVTHITKHRETEWKIKLVDTGNSAMTGARINRCKQYIDEDDFMVSYSDCLADIDIGRLYDFHRKSKKIATITGVVPPYRMGEFLVKANLATGFYNARKTQNKGLSRLVNGGYMVFKKDIFSYLNSFNECRLENDIFSKLVVDKQLAVYQHKGFWNWLDTDRDYQLLTDLVEKNNMYWLQKTV